MSENRDLVLVSHITSAVDEFLNVSTGVPVSVLALEQQSSMVGIFE